jgi:hypothetical protein
MAGVVAERLPELRVEIDSAQGVSGKARGYWFAGMGYRK